MQASALGIKKQEFTSKEYLRTLANEPEGRRSTIQKDLIGEDFKLATLNINQLLGKDKQLQKTESLHKPKENKKALVSLHRPVPLIDTLSGAKIYHFADLDTFHATVITRNVEAPPSWFNQV